MHAKPSIENRHHARPPIVGAGVAMTDEGLVCGAGSILARMTKGIGRRRLASEADADRLVVLLSVIDGAPIGRDKVLRHIEAAAGHWERGDKALANLRLVFADLPKVADRDAAHRLRVAEELLDDGWSPTALTKALWPPSASPGIEKYAPDQPRVPAGNGRKSGEWEIRTGSTESASGASRREPVVVAMEDENKREDEKAFHLREISGNTTFEEEAAHHHLDPLNLFPGGGPGETENQISSAARAAVEAVGPGRGAVYGTKVHTEFKARIDALDRPDIHTEQSYKNGELVKRGSPGSVRVDVTQGSNKEPFAIFDLKTGSASLTKSRIEELREHVPNGADIKIHEVRP